MSHDQQWQVWAKNLSVALKQWLVTNGYEYGTHLASGLDIPEHTWSRISSGRGIAHESEYYARIFLKTGLPEADPRKIPPRPNSLPKGGSTLIQRAMSEEEYEAWWVKYQTTDSGLEPASAVGFTTPAIPVGLTSLPSPNQVVGSLLDDFVDSVAARIAQHLKIQTTPSDASALHIPTLAVELSLRLREIKNLDDPQERERQINSIRIYLADLKHLIGILTAPPKEREESIQQEREVLGQ